MVSMQKERIPIPKPKSAFLLVQCAACGNEQVIFSHTTMDIKCKSCEAVLSSKTGGKSIIEAKPVRRFDL